MRTRTSFRFGGRVISSTPGGASFLVADSGLHLDLPTDRSVGYTTAAPRMQNAERRMKNAESGGPSFSILHSAFCVLHSRGRSFVSDHGRYLAARAMSYLPDRVKVLLSGTPPVIVDGQQLDPHRPGALARASQR